MEYLVQFLESLTASQSQTRWVFLLVVCGSVTLLGMAFIVLAASLFDPMRKRLQSVSARRGSADVNPFAEFVQPLSPFLVPKKGKDFGKIQSNLIHAGYRSTSAVTSFYAIKLILAVSLGGSVLLLAPFYPRFSTMEVIYATLAAIFIGSTVPNYVLTHIAEKRKKSIVNGFPDALDLLVACTEAGLGLNSAIQRVADQLYVSHPELAQELALVNAEIRAGVDRIDALKALSVRTGADDIKGLVTTLAQSMRFGTSIADTLRVYAEDLRDKRTQAAEELAAKIGTKMIFPLIFCMFPSFFVVAVGPALLGVLRALGAL